MFSFTLCSSPWAKACSHGAHRRMQLAGRWRLLVLSNRCGIGKSRIRNCMSPKSWNGLSARAWISCSRRRVGMARPIHPSDRRAYLATMETAELRGLCAFTQEFRLQRADGTYRWFQLRGRAMPGADRTALRCIGTLTDVTSARRLQDRLLSERSTIAHRSS